MRVICISTPTLPGYLNMDLTLNKEYVVSHYKYDQFHNKIFILIRNDRGIFDYYKQELFKDFDVFREEVIDEILRD